MDIEKPANLVEAVLWFGVALVFASKTIKNRGQLRASFLILAVAFLVFGVTDLIESETGAWWRPWWLLVLKAVCVCGFVIGFGTYYKINRRGPIDSRANAAVSHDQK